MWRVNAHSVFLHRALKRWESTVERADNDELKTLTDILRNVYDRVVTVPKQVLVPLSKHRAVVRRLVALTSPLYQRRHLLLQLGPLLRPVIKHVLFTLR